MKKLYVEVPLYVGYDASPPSKIYLVIINILSFWYAVYFWVDVLYKLPAEESFIYD